MVAHAVLGDDDLGLFRVGQARHLQPALALGQALFLAQGGVVAQKNALDDFAVGLQRLRQQPGQQLPALVHAKGEDLHRQQRPEPVHREARQAVRLAEHHPAAGQVLGRVNGLAVGPGVLDAPAPELLVEPVVGVAAQKPHPDPAGLAQKAAAQIPPLAADHIHHRAVFRRRVGGGGDLVGIHPGVAFQDGRLGLGGDGVGGIGSISFHNRAPHIG